MRVRALGREYPLEDGMAIHSSILAWRIPWTEEPEGLQSMGHRKLDTTESNLACTALGKKQSKRITYHHLKKQHKTPQKIDWINQ